MDPVACDAWYGTPRGRWIGETEFHLAARLLAARHRRDLTDKLLAWTNAATPLLIFRVRGLLRA
jgi:hypothetical protein